MASVATPQRSFLVSAALDYLQEKVEPKLIDLSPQGAEELMDRHYPTGWNGFVSDTLNAYKTC